MVTVAKFDEIMNSPFYNHGFLATHLAKDWHTYKQLIAQEGGKEAPKATP